MSSNFAGLPAMSVPLSWTASGLPVGSHFIGRPAGEDSLFQLAGQLERAQPWFDKRPPMITDADAIMAGGTNLTLIDARAEERFSGAVEPLDFKAGHIPGAVCRPFADNLGADGRFLDAAALRSRFAGLGADPVCYCGSGVSAAHNVMALKIAGFEEPRLYPGSWSEWIRDDSRPTEP